MITYRDDKDVDVALVEDLRARCGFTARARDELAQQLAGARWVASAWDEGGRLVGFARAISDGITNAYVSSVMVDAAQRRRGVGRELMRRLMEGRGPLMRWVLHSSPDGVPFYESLGFTPATDIMWSGRRPPPR